MTTLPNETVSATLGLDKRIGLLWLNIILLILFVVTMLSLPVRDAIHCVGGTFLLIGCGVHLALHKRWIKVMILKSPKNVTPTLRRQSWLFWGLLLSGFLCGLSGVVALPFDFFLPLHRWGTRIHVFSGMVFFSFNCYHLVLHRNWFRKNLVPFSTASK
jgi:hypothetical protein